MFLQNSSDFSDTDENVTNLDESEDSSTNPTLKDITLRVRAGELLTVIGSVGAGKVKYIFELFSTIIFWRSGYLVLKTREKYLTYTKVFLSRLYIWVSVFIILYML